eukprot:2049751-Amphidinium_carterae.1
MQPNLWNLNMGFPAYKSSEIDPALLGETAYESLEKSSPPHRMLGALLVTPSPFYRELIWRAFVFQLT